jgi:branched-chain amino acid transport system substrate-binding protein
MKRCAKDFFTTNSVKALVTSVGLSGLIFAAATVSAVAQKKYDTGVSDTEIKIGNIMPYSGPASAYGIIGKTMSAYMRMINDNGGVNGRKINFISYDDAYSPPKTVEQARKLVESDEVFLIFAPLGTAPNAAIQKYMNNMKVPQLFVATGASRGGDPEHFPWTIGWQPNYRAEARIYASYILQHHPDAKIGVLYQNDDFGKDYVIGLKAFPMRSACQRWTPRWSPSRAPTRTFSSISPRRNLRRRRSRNSPNSTGTRSTS